MKILPIPFVFLGLVFPIMGQDETDLTRGSVATPKWEVELPQPIIERTLSKPVEKPAPIDFEVISLRTKKVDVVRAPEMHDLPPITGRINVTVQMVQDPELPEPVEPLSTLEPDAPEVIKQLEELRETYQGTSLVFISATVYDHSRTLLRIYGNDESRDVVTAWSNLDFNHFGGFSTYQVTDGVDGTIFEYGILMGLGNQETDKMAELASRSGIKYEVPKIPKLVDVLKGGPAFSVVEGEEGSSAMATLEQLHDLYRKEGRQMERAFYARKKARAERKAYLLANPTKPDDVTISFWRKTKRPTATSTNTAEQPSR
ncbi:MAG: hypothetical protein ACSHX7_00510 [Luteolibacter sp.]